MAEQTIICPDACTVTVQLEITNPLLNLDTAEGAQIAIAVIAVWAVGFAVRVAVKALNTSDGNETERD
jgi:hypothetical protein